ncbi:hypothetical protein LQZ18_12550 [Lachnospiraceae bacterium ZAX-1]
MIGVIYYFSDVPFMQYQNMYQVIRTGRKKWVLGQVFGIIVQSCILMAANITMTILCLSNHLVFSGEWGKVLNTVALTNAAGQFGFLFEISYEAMTLFQPLELMALTFVFGCLVLSFTGLLMFAISLFANRTIATAVATGMAAMIFVVENALPQYTLAVSRIVPMSWLRVVKMGAKEHGSFILPPFGYMLFVLLVCVSLLCVAIYWRIRYVELQWNKED